MNWKAGTALSILAFVGGGLTIGWLSSTGLTPWEADSPAAPAAPLSPDAAMVAPPPVNPMVTTGVAPQILQPIADSTRTEAMLVAIAARRAIDTGLPLGDLNPRLDAAFGATQPQALVRIRAVEKEGLTPARLAAEFDSIAPMLAEGNDATWDKMRREARNLFTLRRSNTAPAPRDAQLQRIRDLLLSGNAASAIALVTAMPGAAQAQDWLVRARRYSDAQAALDTLEKYALAMPMIAPQAAPLAPPTPPAPEAATVD